MGNFVFNKKFILRICVIEYIFAKIFWNEFFCQKPFSKNKFFANLFLWKKNFCQFFYESILVGQKFFAPICFLEIIFCKILFQKTVLQFFFAKFFFPQNSKFYFRKIFLQILIYDFVFRNFFEIYYQKKFGRIQEHTFFAFFLQKHLFLKKNICDNKIPRKQLCEKKVM